jgi:HEAT repeat protein
LKSSDGQLHKRGFISEKDLRSKEALSCDGLLLLLKSKTPAERTIAAQLLEKCKTVTVVDSLCAALINEKSLYTKIALCDTLASFRELSAEKLCALLGTIGSNQHKSVPQKPFEKRSFPLPRDIAARTLSRIGIAALPFLGKILESGEGFAIREAIDAIGFISFYEKDLTLFDQLIHCMRKHGSDPVIRWKIAVALRSFRSDESRQVLESIAANDSDKAIRAAAKQSLEQMKN